MNESRGFALLFLIVIVALIVGLFGIGSVMVNLFNTGQPAISGTVSTRAQEIEPTVTTTIAAPRSRPVGSDINYNFGTAYKADLYNTRNLLEQARDAKLKTNPEIAQNPSVAGIVSEGIKDQIITAEVKKEIAILPALPATAKSTDVSWIKINSIGVSSPIVQGPDGDAALDQGMWLYPTSYEKKEKILLCHRRYFGLHNPKTCWYMDRVKLGDIIEVSDKNGTVYKYRIVSQSVREGADLSVYRASNDDVIKVITCTPLGSSSHRLVTIASRVIE